MKQDIRLDMGFLGNLKTRKLVRALGDQGVVCLIRLWCYVAEKHPKGVLAGIDKDDLEEIAGWTGERGAFASYAARMRWVDEDAEGVLSVHDWPEHQPYIFHSDKRSQAASVASAARWEKFTKRGVNARRKRGASGPDADRYPPSPAPSPSPDPDPNHKDLTADATAGGFKAPAVAPTPPRPKDACSAIGGCNRRGTIRHSNGGWYCDRHDPDQDQGILSTIGMAR